MKIYHNPRCTKSREALQLLKDNGADVEVIEYLKEVPGEKELKEVLAKLNIPAEELVRKGENIYKEKFKGKNFNEQEWIRIMVEYPKLIERPIVVDGYRAVIGRPPEKVLELL